MAQKLGQVSEGTIVKINENGSPVDFYVPKQNYESGLNGAGRTLVVRKDVYDNRAWDNGNVNAYSGSDLDTWFNGTYKNLLDPAIQTAIGTTKFYYTPGNGNNTVGTLERAIFALSLTELGQSHPYANTEGSALPIASTLRIAYRNGSPTTQWTRSPNTSYTNLVFFLYSGGDVGNSYCKGTYGSRPAFTLPSSLYVSDDGTIGYPIPTLTVPQMVMQGQSATISWTAIEGADSYTLQRKSSADADWTQVYSGANLTYSETVGTWTSLQYRVQAVFDGTAGGWAESAAIPVVSSSALVISGTDGDLGTVVNDIPYSISTDTGNQITATITVNSAVIFSGNVGNSTSDTIPVLDLVNGEGTIVIEASVTASGGPVSAVRTWTYTKAPITFPNAGSVAQLTKEGENIFPKTLAECVRLPGGKTLDEVTAFPCQVYAGSYVGTGTYGESNPNTLTFPFEPKMVVVSANTQLFGASVPLAIFLNGVTSSLTLSQSNGNMASAIVTWKGNVVSWYPEGSSPNAAQQLNRSGTTYYYISIG